MSLADALYGVLAFLTIGYVPLSVRLLRAARVKPPIWALTLFAFLTATIATVVTAYLLAVANKAMGSPIPTEVVVAGLRLLVIPLALFPYLFFWALRTNRFRDESVPTVRQPEGPAATG